MTVELIMLLYSLILAFLLIMAPAAEAIRINGMLALMGNRDKLKPLGAWGLRAQRASANMNENLLLFSGLVLIAHTAGVSTPATVLGAQIFIGARVVHAVCYLVGIPYVRSIAWTVGIVGMGMIAAALL